jgi:hypothetical protein
MVKERYPKIGIRSKNELAKRISGSGMSFDSALELISNVIKHFNDYWYDSLDSDPDKSKYVRSAFNTPLGKLLSLIDQKILAPYDRLIPEYIFGGFSGKNHLQAAHYLLGKEKKRTLLGLDVQGFFEQIHQKRVFHLFYSKCGCGQEGARLLSQLCCVPSGPKLASTKEHILARGFATSTRLSTWCNLDLFIRLQWLVKKQLRSHDPRLAIFIDDIGVSASRVTHEQMEELSNEIEHLLINFDPNQKLPINPRKKKICDFTRAEHLGMKLGRNKLSMGYKARSRRDRVNEQLKKIVTESKRKSLIKTRKAYQKYQSQITKVTSKMLKLESRRV